MMRSSHLFSTTFFLLLLTITKADYHHGLAQDCYLRLGVQQQGFVVHCTGGKAQNELFIKHLRQNVLLPLMVNTALSTDLCPIAAYLQKHGGGRRQHRGLSSASKTILQQLTTDQLETLLQDLELQEPQLLISNQTTDGNSQTQIQSQEIIAEVHTHKHYYLVLSDTGEVVALPPFSDPLSNSSVGQVIDLVNGSNSTTNVTNTINDIIQINIDPTNDIGNGDIGNGNADGNLAGSTSTNSNGNGVFHCNSTSHGQTTNFVNPSYPSFDNDIDGICSFVLEVTDASVCQVRVDFVDTHLLPPQEGECSAQYMTVKGNIWPLGVPRFCGHNDGQHFYIELDPPVQGQPPKVQFSVITSSGEDASSVPSFKWGLWITQVKCDGSSSLESPKGCFQYFTDSSGYLLSFAFQNEGPYLNNQGYRICILTAKGACRISFNAESFGLEKFGNYKTSPYTLAGVSSLYCVRDFLRIPDGSSTGFLHTSSHDRYCGGHFSSLNKAASHQPVVAPILSSLYTVDVRSGDPGQFPTLNSAGVPLNPPYNQAHHSPGFKIMYEQITSEGCPYADLAFVGK